MWGLIEKLQGNEGGAEGRTKDGQAMQKRVIFERLIRRDEDDGAFDREFWKNAGAEARFSAAWEMVTEAQLFRGNNVSESGLQRSVQHIQRRTG